MKQGIQLVTYQFDTEEQCLTSPNISTRGTEASTARHPIDSVSCIRPSFPIADFCWANYIGRNHANKANIAVGT